MAVDEQVFILGQRADVIGNLAHGDGCCAEDKADFQLMRFAHVDEAHLIGLRVEQVLRFCD